MGQKGESFTRFDPEVTPTQFNLNTNLYRFQTSISQADKYPAVCVD